MCFPGNPICANKVMNGKNKFSCSIASCHDHTCAMLLLSSVPSISNTICGNSCHLENFITSSFPNNGLIGGDRGDGFHINQFLSVNQLIELGEIEPSQLS